MGFKVACCTSGGESQMSILKRPTATSVRSNVPPPSLSCSLTDASFLKENFNLAHAVLNEPLAELSPSRFSSMCLYNTFIYMYVFALNWCFTCTCERASQTHVFICMRLCGSTYIQDKYKWTPAHTRKNACARTHTHTDTISLKASMGALPKRRSSFFWIIRTRMCCSDQHTHA